LLFDYPTPVELTGYLDAELATEDAPADPPAPFTAELDRLEAQLLPTLAPSARAELAARLQGFLERVTAQLPDTEPSAAAIFGQSTTDDEIFDFIDNELGLGSDSE
jgi:hypothetical protein